MTKFFSSRIGNSSSNSSSSGSSSSSSGDAVVVVPISGYFGENLTRKSGNMPWFKVRFDNKNKKRNYEKKRRKTCACDDCLWGFY